MPSLSDFAWDFGPAVQKRGVSYFRAGAVEFRTTDPGHLLAYVRGELRYSSEIWWEGEDTQDLAIDYRCTCPYFNENDDPCKHLWAMLLQDESQGLI